MLIFFCIISSHLRFSLSRNIKTLMIPEDKYVTTYPLSLVIIKIIIRLNPVVSSRLCVRKSTPDINCRELLSSVQ